MEEKEKKERKKKKNRLQRIFFLFSIRPPPGFLPMLGPLEAVHDSYT